MDKFKGNDVIMNAIANHTGLHFDGGDNRLFVDSDTITVSAKDMSEKEYSKMEKDIAKKVIKGNGYEVYAWNDCSGYDYWVKDGEYNYIQVTVSILDVNNLDLTELKQDSEKLFNYFKSRYDNVY